MGNYHARCGAGEKPEVETPEAYLSLFGQIPKFDKLIATIRSREISASIILQSQSQLKTIYKDAAETILGNCDTMLFLGGKEGSTLKEISETLGKETIDLYNTSDTRGQSRSCLLYTSPEEIPETPETPTTTVDAPKTGDNTPIVALMISCGLGLVGALGAAAWMKARKKKQD